MRKVEMKTVSQLRDEGYTTFTRQYIGKLIADGVITGVETVGKTFLIPITQKNLKALKRERKPKTPRKLQTSNDEGKTT